MAGSFEVKERVFQGQHIREYPNALAHSQEDAVLLHAKQYIPRPESRPSPRRDPTSPRDDGLTIICFHANGYHKELYEPLLDELLAQLHRHKVRVHSIWMPDQAYMGASRSLNAQILGNEPHWWDFSRDILCMVNSFRAEMRRPIVGLGHSMGADQAVAVSHYHPRVFEGLVLVDPSMTDGWAKSIGKMIKFSLRKPHQYRSRHEAESSIATDPFLKDWDKRVLQRYAQTNFCDADAPSASDRAGTVSTLTHPHIETMHLIRPNLDVESTNSPPSLSDLLKHPDLNPRAEITAPIYTSPTNLAMSWLPSLRPPVLYIYGKGSQVVPADAIPKREAITGAGVGGSGGRRLGQVRAVTLEGGHMLPMTNPAGTAAEAARFLAGLFEEWRGRERAWRVERAGKTLGEKQSLDPAVLQVYSKWDGKPWRGSSASKL